MSSKPAPAVIAVGVIRAGAPTISSAFEVVREEALPSKSPRRPALRPERRPFPKISTNNDQLMMAIRVCVHFGVAQAIPLFTTILVRCGGKGHCWASTEVWMRDTCAPRSTVERWRSILVRVGLIVVEHRGNKSGMIRLTALAGFRLRLLPPEPDPAGDDVSGASRTATYEGASTLIVGGTEAPNRNLEKAPLESEDKTEGAAARRSNAKRSGGRQAQAGKRKDCARDACRHRSCGEPPGAATSRRRSEAQPAAAGARPDVGFSAQSARLAETARGTWVDGERTAADG